MIVPFEGYLVRPDRARLVVSPSYDSLTPEERREYMAAHPDSYLHVTRSVGDSGSIRTPLELARANAVHLQRILTEGNYEHLDPALYLYRLSRRGHEQTAIVGEIALDRFDDRTIRPHERTNVDREDQLALHLEVVAASSSPVAMAYRDDELAELVTHLSSRPPRLDFTSPGDLHQQVWRIDDPDDTAAIAAQLTGPLYVTDGHHRLAAAARLRHEVPAYGDPRARDFVLVAAFPHRQLRAFGYHRVVETDLEPAAIVDVVGAAADLAPRDGPPDAVPPGQGRFAMVCGGRWYDVHLPDGEAGIDVTRLQDRLLEPVFGILAPTSDPRLRYLPETAGMDRLAEEAAASGVGFAVAGIPLDQVMHEADHGRVLPPKSTFFSPKPRSGVFVRLR